MKKNILSRLVRHSVTESFLSLSSLQLLTFVLPLLTFPYLVRVLGPEGFGLLSLGIISTAFFSPIVDFGFNLTGTREVAKQRDDPVALGKLIGSILSAKAILLVFSFVTFTILIVVAYQQKYGHAELFYMYFGALVAQVFYPGWLFQGLEKMRNITILSSVIRLVFTGLIFVFVRVPADILWVPALNLAAQVLISAVSIWIVHVGLRLSVVIPSMKDIIARLLEGKSVFLVDFFPNLYNNLSFLLVGNFASIQSVGYYSVSLKVVEISTSLIYLFRNSAFPYLVKLPHQQKKFAAVCTIFGFIFTIFLICISYFRILDMVLGTLHPDVNDYVFYLSASPLLVALGVAYGSSRLLVQGEDKALLNVTIIYSLFGFLLGIVAVPYLGIIGAIVTLNASRLLMVLLLAWRFLTVSKNLY